MDHAYRPVGSAPRANADYGVFPGLVGLTEPFTALVSGAVTALLGLPGSLREARSRRRTLAALHRLGPRLLADIGLESADLIDVASRDLPLHELARRRGVQAGRKRGRLDTALSSRRPAANDERFRLVA